MGVVYNEPVWDTLFKKIKNANFNTCFFANVKMKINHPKLLFNINFLWLKAKLE